MRLSAELYQRIATAKIYIDEHYQDRIDLRVIASRALLSPYHFHRLFRKIYKCTPLRYIQKKRLEKARSLLADNKPVTDVCSEIGYESLGSFSVLFKKEIGFTPQYYRNMAYKKKTEELDEPRKAVPDCFYSKLFKAKKLIPDSSA